AVKLGAEAVVLHCGRVEMPDATRDLIRLYVDGEADSKEFKDLQSSMIDQRQKLAGPHFKSALKSLRELEPFARNQGVRLGIETRFYYREIPSFEEIGIILDEFRGSNIFYWHDTGHAQFMDHLGFLKHKELLERYGNRLLGIHLHDVIAAKDHYPPSTGEIDFSWIMSSLREETIKVIEAHYPAAPAELTQSKKYLEGLIHGKN
ncbi:MAG: TIM barrel protein, partial [Candidatus Margulisiibacteriota bacterium]